MKEIVKLGTILMLYCIIAAVSLSYVFNKTAPVIEANKNARVVAVMNEILPAMAGGFEKMGVGTGFSYWIGYADTTREKPGGYVFLAYGKGYSSTIETLVGINDKGIITGVKVLFQQETPGLGDKIQKVKRGESEPFFLRQFRGRSALENLAIIADNGIINAISGATISSRALTKSINNSLKKIVEITGGESFEESTAPAPAPEEVKADLPLIPKDEVIAAILQGMTGGHEFNGEDTEFPYWTGYTGSDKSTPGGYAFIARGEGFASTIQTLVGIDPEGTIIGIKILFHEEGEEYGIKLEEIRNGENKPWFPNQFVGKSLANTIALAGDGGDIDGITEATITSDAVTVSIDSGLRKMMEIITGESFAAPEQPEETVAEEDESLLPDFILMGVLPDMDGGYVVEETESELIYWTGYTDDDQTEIGGYVFITYGKGISSTIETLVGTDADGAIIGVVILDHEEAEGFGEKIEEIRDGETDPWFTSQFFGKTPSDTIALTNDGGDIDAVDDAIVSSKAIIESVDDGMKKLLGVLMSWD